MNFGIGDDNDSGKVKQVNEDWTDEQEDIVY